MLFSLYTILTASFAALAAAQYPNSFSVPPSGFAFKAGQTVHLKWTILAGDTVTIKLRSGTTMALNEGTTVVSGLKNTGSYSWTIPSDMVKGDAYALEIVDDDNINIINYTPQFPIDSNVLTSAAAASASASGSAAASTGASTSDTTDTTSTADTTSTTGTGFTTFTNSTTSRKSTHHSTAAASTTTSSFTTSTSTDGIASTSTSTGAASSLVESGLSGGFLVVLALLANL